MRVAAPFVGLAALWLLAGAAPARAQSPDDLRHMSISDLADIDVSSVTKSAQSLSDAPAAIYVITHDDIARSGATNLPEMLRLAPNLYVAQSSASQYVITARGLSGSSQAQNFPNKLLVLIDGRSVYTPLFSGVYWDMQGVLPEDIDRIEVISGPGATLWGANAVNGVINIITRSSTETQGGVLTLQAGDQHRAASLRYGGRISPDLTWRLYATGFMDADTWTSAGARAHDNWSRPQGGFRLDWTPRPEDTVTLQGDATEGSNAQQGAPDEDTSARNLTARWTHSWKNGSALQVQAYYDHAGRLTEQDGGHFGVDTYDLDLQHSFALGARNQIVWGGGVRATRYNIVGTASLFFVPASRTLTLGNLFAQDSLTIASSTTLILGVKVEDDPYSGVSFLPSARLSWKPRDSLMLWGAVSRAIRAPTPFDDDVREVLGTTLFLTGNPSFQREKLTAYELGVRVEPIRKMSFSVSGFYNVYDDLRTIEPAPGGFLPLRWGNGMRGDTYGLEAWADYQLTPWWRLSASYSHLEERFSFDPGASGILGVAQAGDDPRDRASLRSSMNLGRRVTLDADLRYVSALPNPAVPAYAEFNTHLAWNVTDHVQLSLTALNLLHDHHQEFAAGNAIPRSVYAGVQWRF